MNIPDEGFTNVNLDAYIPESVRGINPRVYIKHLTDDVERGPVGGLNVSYYRKDGNEPVIAATAIPHEIRQSGTDGNTLISAIDWSLYPDGHPLHESKGGRWPADEREHVRTYARTRSRIAHRLILHRQSGNIVESIDSALHQLDQQVIEEVVKPLSDWNFAPKIRSGMDASEVKDAAEKEAEAARENWQRLFDDSQARNIVDEATVVTDRYGTQIDRLAHVTNVCIPDDLYTIEIKLTETIHSSHLMQAEAHRHAFEHRLADLPAAAVVRLGAEDGDYEVITTHDENWPSEVLWQRMQDRLDRIEDSLIPVYLQKSVR